jgi:hypothetical protein
MGNNSLVFQGSKLSISGSTTVDQGINSPETVLTLQREGTPIRKQHAVATFDLGTGPGANSVAAKTRLFLRMTDGLVNVPDMTAAVFTTDNGGSLGLGGITPTTCALEVGGTTAIRVPAGTTAQRPTSAFGMIRYNSSVGRGEMFVNDVNGDGTQGDAGWRAF